MALAAARARAGRAPARAARAARAGLLALSLLALAGCVSERREQELGDRIAVQVNRQLPIVRDSALQRYLATLGQPLAAASERPNLHYRFYLVNLPSLNAFALPGGHVYVTRGLIQQTRDRSELAGVLAHEIGHVAARHGARKLERELRTNRVVSMLYSLFLGGEPGLIDQQAIRLAGELWSAKHSRRDEHEADVLAVRYLLRAGVDPHGLLRLLESLHAEESQGLHPAAEWFSTHPLTANRVREIREEIGADPPRAPGDGRSPAELASYTAFLERVDALPALAPSSPPH